MQTITYIIKTSDDEYYCGKTTNLNKRIKQHKAEKYPHWFWKSSRKDFQVVAVFIGDFEKKIKRAGVKFIVDLYRSAS